MREIGFLVVFFQSSCYMKGSTKKGKLAAVGGACLRHQLPRVVRTGRLRGDTAAPPNHSHRTSPRPPPPLFDWRWRRPAAVPNKANQQHPPPPPSSLPLLSSWRCLDFLATWTAGGGRDDLRGTGSVSCGYRAGDPCPRSDFSGSSDADASLPARVWQSGGGTSGRRSASAADGWRSERPAVGGRVAMRHSQARYSRRQVGATGSGRRGEPLALG